MTAPKKPKRAARKFTVSPRETWPSEIESQLQFWRDNLAVAEVRGDPAVTLAWLRVKVSEYEQRLNGDDDMNRNQRAAAMASASQASPGEGWWLRVRVQTKTSTKIYNAGCAADPADFPNLHAMIGTNFEWMPPHMKPTATPRDAPPPAPAQEKPQIIIDGDPDPLVAWPASRALSAESFGGDWGKSLDALLSDPVGRQLSDRYTRLAAERDARAAGLNGRRIAPRL